MEIRQIGGILMMVVICVNRVVKISWIFRAVKSKKGFRWLKNKV
ncbi:hypothetical protein VITU9109_06555 [Vibrio tubiashii ATCC 19109]|uniref:Uncharacterized protein n=1 Tax=Vibrio tubiashii ATCC 19109 TaxID=1051646 RepID=A0ABP2LKP6_9VIBR|nr:hypothetical protein VITU9109_06555 [Vibrio tubiashii ATCC 19109]